MALTGLKLYTYRLAGTLETPTAYNKVGPIKDETLNMEKNLIDVTSRLANGFRLQTGGLIEGSIEASLIYLPGNADFIAFQAAFFNGEPVLMAFVDGPLVDGDQQHGETGTISVQGLWGAFNVTNFSQNRSLEDAVTIDVQFTADLEPVTDVGPSWKTTSVTIT